MAGMSAEQPRQLGPWPVAGTSRKDRRFEPKPVIQPERDWRKMRFRFTDTQAALSGENYEFHYRAALSKGRIGSFSVLRVPLVADVCHRPYAKRMPEPEL